MTNTFNARIIVVEDSDFFRSIIISALKQMGYTSIESPPSAVEAWERIAQSLLDDKPFDLLITDLNMPGFDGVDLISRIKEDPLSEKQKIIVITAEADAGTKSICKKLGVQAYFTKPFKYESLSEVISAILENKKIPKVEDLI